MMNQIDDENGDDKGIVSIDLFKPLSNVSKHIKIGILVYNSISPTQYPWKIVYLFQSPSRAQPYSPATTHIPLFYISSLPFYGYENEVQTF